MLELAAGDVIRIDAGGAGLVNNVGIVRKLGTGLATISASIDNTGAIGAAGGTLQITGAVTGTGIMNIAASDTLELAGAVAAGQTVSFVSTTGSALVLAGISAGTLSFEGTIKAFGGSAKLDLPHFSHAGGPKLSWKQGSGTGTLTITDGADVAKLTLFGQYAAAGFHMAADASGGTVITYTPQAAVQQIALTAPHR